MKIKKVEVYQIEGFDTLFTTEEEAIFETNRQELRRLVVPILVENIYDGDISLDDFFSDIAREDNREGRELLIKRLQDMG